MTASLLDQFRRFPNRPRIGHTDKLHRCFGSIYRIGRASWAATGPNDNKRMTVDRSRTERTPAAAIDVLGNMPSSLVCRKLPSEFWLLLRREFVDGKVIQAKLSSSSPVRSKRQVLWNPARLVASKLLLTERIRLPGLSSPFHKPAVLNRIADTVSHGERSDIPASLHVLGAAQNCTRRRRTPKRRTWPRSGHQTRKRGLLNGCYECQSVVSLARHARLEIEVVNRRSAQPREHIVMPDRLSVPETLDTPRNNFHRAIEVELFPLEWREDDWLWYTDSG